MLGVDQSGADVQAAFTQGVSLARMATINLTGRYYKLSPPGHFAGLQPIALEIDLVQAALLVVDVYGLSFSPEEGAARNHPSVDDESAAPWERIASTAIVPALEAARRAGVPVIYTHNSGPRIELNRSQLGQTLNRTLDCDLEELFRERGVDEREYLAGSENLFLETSEALGPRDGDYFVRKHQYSGFKDTRLDSLLRNLNVTTLFCVGFDAGTCLKMTMVDAFELNYQLVLLRDATAAIELPEDIERGYSFTERIIWWMEAHIGTSITSDQFVSALTELKQPLDRPA
jgi:nicotinamidase-related amidase